MNICNEYFKYSLENTVSATDASKKFWTGMDNLSTQALQVVKAQEVAHLLYISIYSLML